MIERRKDVNNGPPISARDSPLNAPWKPRSLILSEFHIKATVVKHSRTYGGAVNAFETICGVNMRTKGGHLTAQKDQRLTRLKLNPWMTVGRSMPTDVRGFTPHNPARRHTSCKRSCRGQLDSCDGPMSPHRYIRGGIPNVRPGDGRPLEPSLTHVAGQVT